jgi:hypothetical protein
MASIVSINTPEGSKRIKIAGDSPTAEEIERIKKAYPSDDPDFSYSAVVEQKVEEEVAAPAGEPEEIIEGEVTDKSFRYEYGGSDTEEEKIEFLTRTLGPDTFERVDTNTFVIDQEKVNPEIRRQLGLADSGKIYADRPGFSKYDFVDFGGEAGTPLALAIAASLGVTSLAWGPAALIVGAAGGAGKLIDEGIEYFRGTQRQSPGEVGAAVALEAVLAGAVGEVGGRVASRFLGRVFKGPGPAVESERIAELQATGLSVKEATRAAKAEQSARFNQMVRSGGLPGIKEATGKAISARVLAVNEAILPNQKVARENAKFVRKTIDDVLNGKISEQAARETLQAETQAIVNQINRQMADPEAAYKAAQKHLEDVVEVELRAFEDAYVPSAATGMPEDFKEAAKISARLFQSDSKAMYQTAENLIGKDTIQFNLSPLKELIGKARDQKFSVGDKYTFNSPLFNDILTSPEVSLSNLSQIKNSLRIAMQDMEIVPTAQQAVLGKMVSSVDDIMKKEFQDLTLAIKMGGRTGRRPDTKFDPVTGQRLWKKGDFTWIPIGPAEKENIKQGLAQWMKANDFYSNGQEQFNRAATNMIVKNMKDGFMVSNENLLSSFVRPGMSQQLKMYLDAVTPHAVGVSKLRERPVLNRLISARDAVKNGNYEEANKLLSNKEALGGDLSNTVPKIITWIKTLPEDDVLRTMEVDNYVAQLDDLIDLATVGADPAQMRHTFRNSLARDWIRLTKLQSLDNVGQFSPGQFAAKFSSLGDDVQNLLFGSQQASRLRNSMDNFYLVNRNKDVLLRELDNVSETNIPLRQQIQGLKNVIDSSIEESKSSVLQSIRQGSIASPEDLVSGILKEPMSYRRLASVVGDTELSKAGGVKDQIMRNLIHNSFESLDDASIQSGAWGAGLKKAIEKQNSNKALDTILGRETVQSLNKLADDATAISDASLRGIGGLSAPTESMAIAGGLLAGISQLSPGLFAPAVTAMGTAFVMSRMMRNPFVLRMMTSPRLRAAEYQKALAAGADLPPDPGAFALDRLLSIANSEASIVASSGILNVPLSEAPAQVREEQRTGVRPPPRTQTQQPRVRMQSPYDMSPEAEQRAIDQMTNVPGSAANVMRRIEQEKLLGIRQ